MTRKRPAFSLVELLTVIAVIAVLAGILVPIVSTIRARADVLECSSNLRQLGIGVRLYVNENNGIMPGPLWGGQSNVFYQKTADKGNYGGQLIYYLSDYLPVDTVGTNPPRAALMLCPAYVDVIGMDVRDMRPYALRNSNVKMINGKSDKPFGYPGSESQGREDDSPASYFQILEPENEQMMIELDAISVPPYAGKDNCPDTPVHGTLRNVLFLDGHVEAEPADV